MFFFFKIEGLNKTKNWGTKKANLRNKKYIRSFLLNFLRLFMRMILTQNQTYTKLLNWIHHMLLKRLVCLIRLTIWQAKK